MFEPAYASAIVAAIVRDGIIVPRACISDEAINSVSIKASGIES